jgi:Fur family ferric uptake transcriptional regulator
MQSATEFIEARRPAGGRRSGKRDLIVNVFLRQEGHLSAEDLVELIRGADTRISRATVYRTLQWMVDAGIARRVDFGEGRFRFEHSYRHPRHFHLICKSCNQSFEFLSSDIEGLLEEITDARNFVPRQSVLQIYGTCEHCRAGRSTSAVTQTPTEAVFARDALRIAIATEQSGLEFYTRAARVTRDARGRRVFERLAAEEQEHLGKLEARYRELITEHPGLEAEPTFLFFKGAANGLFAAGTEELQKGVDDRRALDIGIRCERGSHKFFKRYGERFEESEGKRIFLEFAEEEREHLNLLIREHRALVARQRKRPRGGRRSRSA